MVGAKALSGLHDPKQLLRQLPMYADCASTHHTVRCKLAAGLHEIYWAALQISTNFSITIVWTMVKLVDRVVSFQLSVHVMEELPPNH